MVMVIKVLVVLADKDIVLLNNIEIVDPEIKKRRIKIQKEKVFIGIHTSINKTLIIYI